MRKPSNNVFKLLFIESEDDVEYDPSSETGYVRLNGKVYDYTVDERGLGVFYDESGSRVYGDLARELAAELDPVKKNRKISFVTNVSSRRSVGNQVPAWMVKYDDEYEKLENNGMFTSLPQSLHGIFKDPANNYRLLIDNRDFAAIFPTPTSLRQNSSRGVYLLRSVAHQDFPQFKIKAGDRFDKYVPQIAQGINTDYLLAVRKVIEDLGLGMFFRRDQRINTVTKWIPDAASFKSYDELTQYANYFIENDISRCCKAINEALRRLIRIG